MTETESGVTAGVSRSPIRRDVGRVLVVGPSWVGDTVMCTPVLRAIRRHRPGAQIDVALRPGLAPILEGSPLVDRLITVRMKGALGPLRLARAVRGNRPDAALLLPNSFRSALAVRLGRPRVRIGYDRDGRGPLLTHRLATTGKRGGPVPMVDYYAALARFALGIDEIETEPELSTTPDQERGADDLLGGVSSPFVLLNPGANRADKRWPAERFAAAADALVETDGMSAVITGAPGERSLLERVEQAARHPMTNLARRGVTLGTLKAVVRRAALLVTNDTGPRHLAAALGTPAVVLFGPTDHRWTTLPVRSERLLLAEPFLPETLMADRQPRTCAIDRIQVTDVLHAARWLLAPAPCGEASS